MRRKRRPTQPGDFDDPLSNYEGPEYADALEGAIAEESMSAIKSTPFTSVLPDTTIGEVMAKMDELGIACMLVTDADMKLLGIISERDVLIKIADDFETMKSRPVSEIMTPDPQSVYETDPPAKAMNLMAVGGYRHIPILNVDDKVVGIIGPRRVNKFLQSHFAD